MSHCQKCRHFHTMLPLFLRLEMFILLSPDREERDRRRRGFPSNKRKQNVHVMPESTERDREVGSREIGNAFLGGFSEREGENAPQPSMPWPAPARPSQSLIRQMLMPLQNAFSFCSFSFSEKREQQQECTDCLFRLRQVGRFWLRRHDTGMA